jgi:hypothetical protein
MATNREQLKAYFQTGDIPTEGQFGELIDSLAHRLDPEIVSIIAQVSIDNQGVHFKNANGEVVVTADMNELAEEIAVNGDFINSLSNTFQLEEPDQYGTERRGIVKHHRFASLAGGIFHIKTPMRVDTHSQMFHFSAEGYFYGSGQPVDIVWVGYCYKAQNSLIRDHTSVLRADPTKVQAGQYIGSDNHIYLWIKPSSLYYSTFRINTIRVASGFLFKEGDLEVIESTEAQL